MRIFKYPLKIDDQQSVLIPEGAQPLCVQLQDRVPTLWAIVNPSASGVQKRIVMYGTGWEYNHGAEKYLGTIQQDGFVWHYFW